MKYVPLIWYQKRNISHIYYISMSHTVWKWRQCVCCCCCIDSWSLLLVNKRKRVWFQTTDIKTTGNNTKGRKTLPEKKLGHGYSCRKLWRSQVGQVPDGRGTFQESSMWHTVGVFVFMYFLMHMSFFYLHAGYFSFSKKKEWVDG